MTVMIRIGVIGAGIMGSLHAEAYQQNPNAELIAVCDFIREKAEKAAEKFEAGAFYTDYRKMIEKEELDAVAVATPDFAHTDPVITALEAGLDVIVEKPLATEREDADRIVKAVEKSGCNLMVNYGNRMRPQHRRVKQMIENDELGNPIHAYAKLMNSLSVPLEMLSWSSKSSPTWFLMSHMVDMIRWWFNAEAVMAYASKTEGVLNSKGVTTHDTMTAIVKFENGATATFETAWILPNSLPRNVDHRIELIGTKGFLKIDQFKEGLEVYTDGVTYPSSGTTDLNYKRVGWWFESVNYFIHCLENDIKPKPDENDGRAVTNILLAIIESAERDEPVKIT